MSQLIIKRKSIIKGVSIPLWFFIEGRFVGIIRTPEATINIPPGTYLIELKTIGMLWKWKFELSGGKSVSLTDDEQTELEVLNKTEWWDIVFYLDIVLSVIFYFIDTPHPWNIIYSILSNSFFIIWLFHLWRNRNQYYDIIETKK